MNEPNQQTLLERIGSFFKRGNRPDDLPLSGDHGNGEHALVEHRSSFLRPWARRDAAINNLQEGFHTLTDLMGSIKDNLEKQAVRQDELMEYLSQLPQIMKELPESSRLQGETLRAIHLQLESQNLQQEKLGEILDKMADSGNEQKSMLGNLQERVENFHQTDELIANNLQGVGSALQNVTRNTAAGTEVLQQIRDTIDQRDDQLERILHKQNTRFTTMLAIAITMSVAALAAVAIIGYLLVTRQQ